MTLTSGIGPLSHSLKSWALGINSCAIVHDRADKPPARATFMRTDNRNPGLAPAYRSARIEKAHGHGAADINVVTKNSTHSGCVGRIFSCLNKTIVGTLNCNVPLSWLGGGTSL